MIALKKATDSQIFEIESKLFGLENDYLSHGLDGSLIKGVDGYLGIRTSTPHSSSSRKIQFTVDDEGRVFTKAAFISSLNHKEGIRFGRRFNNVNNSSNYSEETGTTSDADYIENDVEGNHSDLEEGLIDQGDDINNEEQEDEKYKSTSTSSRNRSRGK